MNEIKLPRINCQTVCKEIGDFIINTVNKMGSTGCIVGLSGGVDSSTTAALIKSAFDRHNSDRDDTLELVGYILPSNINKMEDAKDAQILVKALGIRYEIHSIEKPVEAFKQRRANPGESAGYPL
jgi:NAD+ synthase